MNKITTPKERRFELDWLRVIAFSLLVFFHTGMIFKGWHITNKDHSHVLDMLMQFVSQWRMPVLFIISGAGVFFALKRRSQAEFMKERLQRLLIPLIFGTLVIIPPQIYIHRIFRGETFASYFDFYKTVLEFQLFPKGNFAWLHLWFIIYILIFSVVTLPIFGYFRTDKGKQFLANLTTFLERPGLIYLTAIPLAMPDILLRLYWHSEVPILNDLFRMGVFLILFIYGYIFFSNDRIPMLFERYRFISLAGGLAATVLLYIFRASDENEVLSASFVLYRVLRNLNVVFWVYSLIGFGRVYLNINSSWLEYANEAVYPFYILHQTVMILLGYYVIQWDAGILPKFLVISIGTFTITLFLYEFVIRRTNVTRFLFGLKPLKARVDKPVAKMTVQ